MTQAQIEQSLESLRRDVDSLKKALRPKPEARTTTKWWLEDAGRFANDPVFDEIVKLGREYRESLRPKPRGKKKAKRAHS